MSNHINTIQSQYQAVDLARIYRVYNHLSMRDASYAFHELPLSVCNQVFGQVYELAGRPVTDDLSWGGHHAFEDIARLQAAIRQVAFNLFRTMPVEQRNAVAGRVYVNSGSPETSDLQWGENHANDNVDILFRSLIGRPEPRSNPSPSISQQPSFVVSERNEEINDDSVFRCGRYRDFANSLQFVSMGCVRLLRGVFSAIGNSLSLNSITSDLVIERKRAAISRLNVILSFGNNVNDRFDLTDAISTFNLDVILQDYAENHNPRRLLELFPWAGIGNARGEFLTDAAERYENHDGPQERLVLSLFSKLFSYFHQKKNQSEVSQDDLRAQFRGIVDKMIDANRNCVDQMLSQLQDVMLDIAVDAYIPTESDKRLGKILCRAGQELCLYKTHLIRQICVRQNPNEAHMADLERLVMQRLSAVLGLQGAIFNSGARFGHFRDLDNKISRAINAFWQDYRPLEYLSNQLSIVDTNMSKLRNALLEWADDHYAIAAEQEENPNDTDMNPYLSADFNPNTFKDFLNGGVWSPAGTLFLMETAGLIRQV